MRLFQMQRKFGSRARVSFPLIDGLRWVTSVCEGAMAVSTDPAHFLEDSCPVSEDDKLERQAIQELVNEAKRAKERAETMGTSGWQKRRATTNKRFLHNTLVSTLRDYGRESRHRHKVHSHYSSRTTVESKRTGSAWNGTQVKSPHDEVFGETGQDSGHVEEGDEPNAKNGSRISVVDGGERENDAQKSSHSPRPRTHIKERRKDEHGERHRSKSPVMIDNNSNPQDDDDLKKHHYKHAKRHKSEKQKKGKHKCKHKNEHSRSEGHRNLGQHEKRPRRSPVL